MRYEGRFQSDGSLKDTSEFFTKVEPSRPEPVRKAATIFETSNTIESDVMNLECRLTRIIDYLSSDQDRKEVSGGIKKDRVAQYLRSAQEGLCRMARLIGEIEDAVGQPVGLRDEPDED